MVNNKFAAMSKRSSLLDQFVKRSILIPNNPDMTSLTLAAKYDPETKKFYTPSYKPKNMETLIEYTEKRIHKQSNYIYSANCKEVLPFDTTSFITKKPKSMEETVKERKDTIYDISDDRCKDTPWYTGSIEKISYRNKKCGSIYELTVQSNDDRILNSWWYK